MKKCDSFIMDKAETASSATEDSSTKIKSESLMLWFLSELTGSPINLLLLMGIFYLLYRIIFKRDSSVDDSYAVPPSLPPLKKQDFNLKQLKEYDGTGEDGRVLVAVNGNVYDVTKGKSFYGPGGPYSSFAGRDASRGLATFSVSEVSDEYDDLSDLKTSEMDQIREWDTQFSEKYAYVGKLLKPGEEPTSYSDDEESEEDEESDKKDN